MSFLVMVTAEADIIIIDAPVLGPGRGNLLSCSIWIQIQLRQEKDTKLCMVIITMTGRWYRGGGQGSSVGQGTSENK